ncbi:unnamed protein product [Miscanthus lutarioriparius]|uniref:Protein kinase domain-containing protein n=1 Tax=Miscanthus lutarioriparius TaxID=422564 RepID=A0A811QLA3_9POAL|nr:unnamed protein product [Miscanthus lutarioriparius]
MDDYKEQEPARCHVNMEETKEENAGIFSNPGGKDGNSYGSRTSSASVPPNVKIFNFADLRLATKTFRPDSVLGDEEEYWGISKGWIDEETLSPCLSGLGMAIAVKRHELGLQAKVHYLGMSTHPNLVKLIGYCTVDDESLLVCEYMQRGSLENHLSRRSSSSPLSWNLRLKVALGAAKGLAFLHSAKIVYRDMMTSNILLDTAYDAKLSCFGSNGPIGARDYVSTAATLTYAYAAPDDLSTGELTVQSDIYGFGVVLLELLTGRCAFDINRPKGEQNLVEWARPHLINRRKICRLVDTRLGGEYSTGGVKKVAALALECLVLDAKMRSSMGKVVSVLEGIRDSIDQHIKRAHLKSNGKGKMWTFG